MRIMANDNNLRGWVLVVGVLLILGLAAFGVVSAIQQSARQAQQAIQPVSDMTSNVATQVAQFMHPTPTVLPDPVTVIQSVRSLARLETIQYSVEKVITAETNQGPFGFLFGDRLVLVAHGIVIAGVDMQRLTPENLEVRAGALYVHMPAPEIFIATLDNNKSYIYNRDTGLLTHGSMNLETEARRAAEVEIEKAALDDGILTQARQNAENYLDRLLRGLGYPEVIFIQPTPEDDG
jgi:hypothetical protein